MKKTIRIILILAVAVSFVIISIYIYNLLQNKRTTDEIQAIYDNMQQSSINAEPKPSETPDAKPEVEISETPSKEEVETIPDNITGYVIDLRKNPNSELLAINSDFVGWVKVEGTNVDYPVVKHSDNDFYLNRDFYKEDNIAGSIYMDYRNFGNKLDGNIVIYGHNMKNGTMFNSLNNYKDEGFFNDNMIITFSNLYETFEYEIFSVYWVSADDYKLEFDFKSNDINEYYNFLKSESIFQRESVITDVNQIITLATCSYEVDNGRLMVHGVLINN
ncbi:MAG: class B sortase [Clostridia bacterium]|nr:class B sortase [Clostridia bacterium]MBN2882429.1 class B sortase [Clostridia bacterium]